MNLIAFDSHKHYTLASIEGAKRKLLHEGRIEHRKGAIRNFLTQWKPGSPVAVETIGNWYWIVDEIEAAGMLPQLVHARRAKLMMGNVNKTDKLDARGMNLLQRNGTLPTVWIPPADLRDKRELPRTRMVLAKSRVRLKNRIHSTLAKYALTMPEVSDIFGSRNRPALNAQLDQLPAYTRYAIGQLMDQLALVQKQIDDIEEHMSQALESTPDIQLLMTIPGVGFILGVVIGMEIGEISRFPSAEHLASYSGTTPRVHSSGGKTRFGRLRPDVNHYLQWAFIEAANCVCLNHKRWKDSHLAQLYVRIRNRKGHAKAIGAVARHLAEATYYMLNRRQHYLDPNTSPSASSKEG